jgi:hypothetical protein
LKPKLTETATPFEITISTSLDSVTKFNRLLKAYGDGVEYNHTTYFLLYRFIDFIFTVITVVKIHYVWEELSSLNIQYTINSSDLTQTETEYFIVDPSLHITSGS